LGEERPLHRFLTLGVSLESSSTRKRPLSPFLTVYRWQYTMALSILHRVTGCALSVGLLLFAYWLVAVASGRSMYYEAREFFVHPLMRVMLIGFSFAFFYHLLNGVRHMTWDTGHGLERKSARLSGWIVFLGAVATTALFWLLIARRFGGAA
jgi:succinate dehydrogenase / fumarate reductase, cytochrome b subunit